MPAREFKSVSRPAFMLSAVLLAGCQTAPPGGIPAENQRVAFESQCGLNVIVCTTSWPTAVASVIAGEGQTVTPTADGYLIEVMGGAGAVPVQFRGADSIPGNTATSLSYSWSYGAVDSNPCTLAPGYPVATIANPVLSLSPGFHYIRLSVVNDVIRDQVVSDDCGVIAEDTGSFDFVELEIEVRRN